MSLDEIIQSLLDVHNNLSMSSERQRLSDAIDELEEYAKKLEDK